MSVGYITKEIKGGKRYEIVVWVASSDKFPKKGRLLDQVLSPSLGMREYKQALEKLQKWVRMYRKKQKFYFDKDYAKCILKEVLKSVL